jgi:hypothetical protein
MEIQSQVLLYKQFYKFICFEDSKFSDTTLPRGRLTKVLYQLGL